MAIQSSQGVKFHDGSTLDAADIVASFQRARTLHGDQSYTGAIATVKEVKASMKARYRS